MYIRKIFFLEKIYFKQTLMQIFATYGLLALVAFIIVVFYAETDLNYSWATYVYGAGVILYSYLLIRTIIRTIIVNIHLRKPTRTSSLTPGYQTNIVSINNELDKIDEMRIIEEDNNSRLYYAIFNFYTQTRYGDYLSKQVYYTVFEIQLIRQLPHILFDSKSAKKRQFKYIYLKSQRVSVQGHFDDYFDTYAPQTYHIDSLSFITPEVMELLIDAKDCDIEIVNDRLILYGPFTDKRSALDIQQKGRVLAAGINDNINTYKDNRLIGEDRHKKVTMFGRSLLKSPIKDVVFSVFFGLITVAIIVSSTMSFDGVKASDILFNYYSILVYICLIVSLYKVIKINRYNNQQIKQFRAVQRYSAKARKSV